MTLRSGGGPLTLYVCGPTVYAPSHVGHARTYLSFDMLRRYLEDAGRPTRHLMNVTDVEDKIDRRAEELGISPVALARREERRFFADLARLNVLPPTFAPRASSFVGDMVRIARRLERTGRVEPIGTGLFFRPPKRPGHQNFALARTLDRHMVEEPPTVDGPRLDPRAFLVWRRQSSNGLSFPSPLGTGVPGWHLECYAMAEKYLGVPVDIQGGGQDLIFPHHYAQNEVALTLGGHPFARGFLHTGFVVREGRKMSKSVGNLVDLGRAIAEFGAPAIRLYLLSVPRSESIEWSGRAVARLARRFAELSARLREALRPGVGATSARELESLAGAMSSAVGDDLGADRAFALLDAWADGAGRRANLRLKKGERAGAVRAVARIADLTGLPLPRGG